MRPFKIVDLKVLGTSRFFLREETEIVFPHVKSQLKQAVLGELGKYFNSQVLGKSSNVQIF